MATKKTAAAKSPAVKSAASKSTASKTTVPKTTAPKTATPKTAARKSATPKAEASKNKVPKNEAQDPAATRFIDDKIKELGDWRGATLARLRALIKEADPEIIEEVKWRGVPVWSHAGIVCTGETYKAVVKMTFARGAALEDPASLFNSSLEGNTRRAIDIREGEKINEKALKALFRAAVLLNQSKAKR